VTGEKQPKISRDARIYEERKKTLTVAKGIRGGGGNTPLYGL